MTEPESVYVRAGERPWGDKGLEEERAAMVGLSASKGRLTIDAPAALLVLSEEGTEKLYSILSAVRAKRKEDANKGPRSRTQCPVCGRGAVRRKDGTVGVHTDKEGYTARGGEDYNCQGVGVLAHPEQRGER